MILLFCKLHYLGYFPGNITVALPFVGTQAIGAVLDAVFRIGEMTATLVPQGVQGAIAKQAAEALRVSTFVTGEIFAGFILKKIEICHSLFLLYVVK